MSDWGPRLEDFALDAALTIIPDNIDTHVLLFSALSAILVPLYVTALTYHRKWHVTTLLFMVTTLVSTMIALICCSSIGMDSFEQQRFLIRRVAVMIMVFCNCVAICAVISAVIFFVSIPIFCMLGLYVAITWLLAQPVRIAKLWLAAAVVWVVYVAWNTCVQVR